MDARVIEGALIGAPLAVWFGIYGLALLATRPGMPDPEPATPDLGAEPPAVVSLLVNRWEITEDAAESTLLDLAARHILEFRQPGNDPRQTTVHIKSPQPAGLNRYEQLVFDRVSGLAVAGVVPLTALTFRDPARAQRWAKQLSADVVADARLRGLSQRRLGSAIVTALVVLAGGAAATAGAGMLYALNRTSHHHTVKDSFWTAVIAFFVLSAIAGRSHGERDTEAGRVAAARWLGVRGWLRGHDAFADLPPAAVTVWDRYLSYGAAVGATRVSSAVIDLGMGNRRRVWSSFGPSGSSQWHQVRVHYPRFWPRYGRKAPYLVLRGIIAAAIGVLLIRYWYSASGSVLSTSQVADSPAGSYAGLIKGAGLLAGFVLVGYGGYVLLRTVLDLAIPMEITGEVIWTESWRTRGSGENSGPWLYYAAIDDGSADSTKAWGLPSEMLGRCHDGDTVTITVRRWSRRVTAATLVKRGGEHRLALSDVGTASENTEALIAVAMGIPGPRGANRGTASVPSGIAAVFGPLTPAGPLLTPAEVGNVLGVPVQPGRNPEPDRGAPVDVSSFDAPDGTTVLTVVRSGGMIAKMAMRARKQGSPVPGIGDEAYAGPGWIVVRRGEAVVALHAGRMGLRDQQANPQALAALATSAVSRLPAAVF